MNTARLIGLTITLLILQSTSAVQASEAVHSLAEGCYLIQSPATGRYLQQINDRDLKFQADSVVSADRFYFKPTRFNYFMLTNTNRRYLSTRLPLDATAGDAPGVIAEWLVKARAQNNGSFRYSFKSTSVNRTLRHNYRRNKLYFIDFFNPFNWGSEVDFNLIATMGCVSQPEIELNVSGDRNTLKGYVDMPVRGFIDPHTHIHSNEFMGGKFVHGEPFHRFGVTYALDDSSVVHGPNGALDLIGNIFAYDDINNRYDTRGWPDFPHWPRYQDVSHTGYYYKWIERAHLGGLRMMVTHMVENKVLCTIQSTINPAAWINPNSCDPMDSIRLQVQRLHELQDYIDAQQGGPGKGFFRIVRSPAEARQVIADGKLAVVMSIEVSELFDCGVRGACTTQSVEQQLQDVYNLGIRGLFPTHRFDNKFGGAEIEGGFLNLGQWLSTGYLFDTQECDDGTKGAQLEPGFPLLQGIPVIGDIANSITNAPDYDPDIRHCNTLGLNQLGAYLVNRMIDMGMLIELDHTSEKSASAILNIIESRNYSGVISSHSHLSVTPDDRVHRNFKRIVQVGGFVAPMYEQTDETIGDIDEYLSEVEATPFLDGVGFSTDMTGLSIQPAPRDDAEQAPLNYPFYNEFGLRFDRQRSGNRIIDLNNDGMAHLGMLADYLQDLRERAPSRIYEAVMNSTEAYLQMWERARAQSSGN